MKLLIEIPDEIFTSKDIDLTELVNQEYIYEIAFSLQSKINHINAQIMDELVKHSHGNLYAASCIELYRKERDLLVDMKSNMKATFI